MLINASLKQFQKLKGKVLKYNFDIESVLSTKYLAVGFVDIKIIMVVLLLLVVVVV